MSEPKYIDANRLIRRLENRTYRAKGKFIEMVNEQPAVDVVEVVRCKDCKHRYVSGYTTQYYVCDFMDAELKDEGYCSYGERKDG